MKFALRPYQPAGIKCLKENKRFLLLDEMGLGKTVQALEACRELGEQRPRIKMLYITQANLLLDVRDKILEWFGDEAQVIEIKSAKTEIRLTKKYCFVLASYNYIRTPARVERLHKVKWDIICCDESHAMKNPLSATTKEFMRLKSSNEHAWIWWMTGTVAKKNGADYYTSLKLLRPDRWGSYSQFKWDYCERIDNGFGITYGGIRKEHIATIRGAFKKHALRRLKKDHVKDLPKVTYQTIHVAAKYEAMYKIDESTGLFEGTYAAPADSEYQQIGIAKIPDTVEFVTSIGRPVVVFCIHKAVVTGIVEGLEKAGLRVATVTGSESREEKHSNVNDFQAGKLDAIVCNIAAGGVGITLTYGSDVVFAQFPASPADYRQAVARVDRIGQVNPVNVWNLVVRNSYDDKVTLPRLNEREENMSLVMNEERKAI